MRSPWNFCFSLRKKYPGIGVEKFFWLHFFFSTIFGIILSHCWGVSDCAGKLVLHGKFISFFSNLLLFTVCSGGSFVCMHGSLGSFGNINVFILFAFWVFRRSSKKMSQKRRGVPSKKGKDPARKYSSEKQKYVE